MAESRGSKSVLMQFAKVALLVSCGVAFIAGWVLWLTSGDSANPKRRDQSPNLNYESWTVESNELPEFVRQHPRPFGTGDNLAVWWESIPVSVTSTAVTSTSSNIHKNDYAGPDACVKCHADNHTNWSNHSHRWMNAIATEESVRGDFSGDASIQYLGGKASFYREGNKYRMRLVRDTTDRLYEVNQTIGSRFYQYYVGKQLTGPEPSDHEFYRVDHVLPFGYWLDRQEWVPVVHVGTRMEGPDGQRVDPFEPVTGEPEYSAYHQCNSCHTTFPLGDMFVRDPTLVGRHPPKTLHFAAQPYLAATHPDLRNWGKRPWEFQEGELDDLFKEMFAFEALDHAVTLGISCEACHLGAAEHAKTKAPIAFFPQSQHLYAETNGAPLKIGRTRDNVHWACGRCHAGKRPRLAVGCGTWNSTEYSDAVRGACYSELTCVNCHDPHKAIGSKWSKTPEEDDASCIKCHQQFESSENRRAHTHHSDSSEGSRCMNCHMPRITEGLQDVIRTHMIFSPTNEAMLNANHPNACNLCHTEKPISWTVSHLRDWYGADKISDAVTDKYETTDEPAISGWLESEESAVRLVATDAVARQNDLAAIDKLVEVLDDPYLLNRQFARVALEKLFDFELSEYGYHFYQTPEERQVPIQAIRSEIQTRSNSSEQVSD